MPPNAHPRARRIGIIQSNYIPWKGYFDLIHDCDLFLFYDEVQFTKNDWRNRNKVKTPSGVQWITVPVGADISRSICDVRIPNALWQTKHLKTLAQLYGKAPYFDHYRGFLDRLYVESRWQTLSELNQFIIRTVAHDLLGIATEFRSSTEFAAEGRGQQRVLGLCKAAGATVYISGPAAKSYLDAELFRREGIDVVWKDYSGYPEYPQFHPPFEHAVTILDLLFQVGPAAPQFIWGWRAGARS
jgi:hypothetical protein